MDEMVAFCSLGSKLQWTSAKTPLFTSSILLHLLTNVFECNDVDLLLQSAEKYGCSFFL